MDFPDFAPVFLRQVGLSGFGSSFFLQGVRKLSCFNYQKSPRNSNRKNKMQSKVIFWIKLFLQSNRLNSKKVNFESKNNSESKLFFSNQIPFPSPEKTAFGKEILEIFIFSVISRFKSYFLIQIIFFESNYFCNQIGPTQKKLIPFFSSIKSYFCNQLFFLLSKSSQLRKK